MNKTINFGLRNLFKVISSYEVLNQLGVTDDDKLILKGYWVDKKARINIANELNLNPHTVSTRYTKLINSIRDRLQNLITEYVYYKQKVEELEEIKKEYINFHLKKTGKYPKFMIKDDSMENVNMSERLRNRLIERDINRLKNLKNFTKADLLKGRNFGYDALDELAKVITKYNICLKE